MNLEFLLWFVFRLETYGEHQCFLKRCRQTQLQLQRGQSYSETDLLLLTNERKPLRFYVGLEDSGVELTGRQRAIAGVNWGNAFGLLQSNARAIDGLLVLYLGMMVSSFSHHIFTSKQVDLELISAALCLYLLLAMLWASLFTLLEGFMPGSFAGSGLAQAETLREYHQYFNYFSLVTITTLGYGDITPQTPLAMTLCQVEAILGQFFIAVLVARLVGIQIAQSFTERKQ